MLVMLMLRPIVVMALNTGMRKGEILNLKWENIDLKNSFILLNQEQTKNGERKEIPINSTLRESLKRLQDGWIFRMCSIIQKLISRMITW